MLYRISCEFKGGWSVGVISLFIRYGPSGFEHNLFVCPFILDTDSIFLIKPQHQVHIWDVGEHQNTFSEAEGASVTVGYAFILRNITTICK